MPVKTFKVFGRTAAKNWVLIENIFEYVFSKILLMYLALEIIFKHSFKNDSNHTISNAYKSLPTALAK